MIVFNITDGIQNPELMKYLINLNRNYDIFTYRTKHVNNEINNLLVLHLAIEPIITISVTNTLRYLYERNLI